MRLFDLAFLLCLNFRQGEKQPFKSICKELYKQNREICNIIQELNNIIFWPSVEVVRIPTYIRYAREGMHRFFLRSKEIHGNTNLSLSRAMYKHNSIWYNISSSNVHVYMCIKRGSTKHPLRTQSNAFDCCLCFAILPVQVAWLNHAKMTGRQEGSTHGP